MKKNFGVKNWMFPMPVLMIGTYNEDGTPNMMNAAWGGITLEDQITICIDTSHRTWANIAALRRSRSPSAPPTPRPPATTWASSAETLSRTKWRRAASPP